MLLRGKAEQILPTGETVVRTDAGVVLVPDAVPGDILDIALTGKRRGAARGDILAVIESSRARVDPPCPIADRCGGCSLQFLAVDEHAGLKSEWVRQAFQPFIEQATEWIPARQATGKRRRRLRWTVGQDDSGLFLGFQARASHRPVRQQHCMVVTDELHVLRQQLDAEQGVLSDIKSIQAIHLHDGIHVIFEGDSSAPDITLPFETVAGLPLQWWFRDDQGTRPLSRPVRKFHDNLPGMQKRPDILIEIGPDDFIQAEAEGNADMIRQIHSWAGEPRRAADLFAGVGNLSLSLAAAGVETLGAEANVSSVRAANRNAKRLGIPAKYIQADLFGHFDTAAFSGMDLIILDPPRRGARKICQQMRRMLPHRIIMVSCDSAAGARDAAILRDQGYRLHALRALDMFPFAGHVEAMSLWSQ